MFELLCELNDLENWQHCRCCRFCYQPRVLTTDASRTKLQLIIQISTTVRGRGNRDGLIRPLASKITPKPSQTALPQRSVCVCIGLRRDALTMHDRDIPRPADFKEFSEEAQITLEKLGATAVSQLE